MEARRGRTGNVWNFRMVKSLRVRGLSCPGSDIVMTMGLLTPPLPASGPLGKCVHRKLPFPWKIYSAAICFLFVATVSLFSPFKYQTEFMKIIGANNIGMEEKASPGDDCGKRQMERESKTPTSLIGTLETGR
jgi:hypothetical protein